MALVLVAAGLLVLVLYVLPSVLVGPDTELTTAERLKAENDVRTTLIQALGGAILLSGLYFTGRTFVLNREGQVTERFTRAIDQLGNKDSLDVRLGGIYALERIAQESKRDHWPIMEVLTAFISEDARRVRSEWEDQHPGKYWSGPYPKVPAADVYAALTVLRRRSIEHEVEGQRLALKEANLRGAPLEGACLRHADLWAADLRGAQLQGADLRAANLRSARLLGVHMERADLREANLENAYLRAAYLEGADLRAANLRDADLIEAHLEDADLSAADLRDADLGEVHLEGAIFIEAHLEYADLRGSNITEEQVRPAFVDEDTKLPPYLKL